MFIKTFSGKAFQVSNEGQNDVRSIKAVIQALSYQLWFEKRATYADVDWLVDGRLMDQLNGLSKDNLMRVKYLLKRGVRRGRRSLLFTFSTVMAPCASHLPNTPA